MEMQDYQYLQGLDNHQQMLYMTEVNNRKRSQGAAFALAFILGPWAHRLYLRQFGLGAVFLILQVVLVLAFMAIFPIFLFLGWYIWELTQVSNLVRAYNDQVAAEVAAGMSYLKRPETA